VTSFVEQPLYFDCAGERLLGIATLPQQTLPLGVVVVVGGPQYRVGSHRQFVALARALAQAGHATLRFDARGMGDSSGAPRGFESLSDDIAAAITALLGRAREVKTVVLWGLCDGASAALLYTQQMADSRVSGLALLNPWVRSASSLARTHVKRYYLERLQQRAFWAKLLSGQVAGQALMGLLRNLNLAVRGAGSVPAQGLSFQQRMAAGWAGFSGPVLLLISEKDLTGQEFLDTLSNDPDWQRALLKQPANPVTIAQADHTCSVVGTQVAVEQACLRWLGQMTEPVTAASERTSVVTNKPPHEI
jgi:uncharacterized protein